MTYRIHYYQPQIGDIPAQNIVRPLIGRFLRLQAIEYMLRQRANCVCAIAHDENGKILSLEEVKAA